MKRYRNLFIVVQIMLIILLFLWTARSKQDAEWYFAEFVLLFLFLGIVGSLWHDRGVIIQGSLDDSITSLAGYLSLVIVATSPIWLGFARQPGLVMGVITLFAIILGFVAFDLTVTTLGWDRSRTVILKHFDRFR